MSKAQSGKNNPMYGRPVSEETRKKLSQSHIGKNIWCKGRKLSEEHKKHISESLLENHPFLGKSHSDESNLKNKLSHKNRISIICVETGEIFLSIRDSVRSMGTTKCQIKKCLDDPERTCVGYHWRRYE